MRDLSLCLGTQVTPKPLHHNLFSSSTEFLLTRVPWDWPCAVRATRGGARHVPLSTLLVGSNDLAETWRVGGERKGGREGRSLGLPLDLKTPSPMVPAACMLLWALLLSLESRAAGAEDQTTTPIATTIRMQRVSFHFGGPARSLRSTNPTARSSVSRKQRVILDDEHDALATADRLAVPAAAELLSTVTGYSRSSLRSPDDWEDGSLEEGVVDTRKTTDNPISIFSTTNTVGSSGTTKRFVANSQEREIRLTTDLRSLHSKTTVVDLSSETTLQPWSTPGSTPSPWRKPSFTAMPSPEDLRVVLMPWGPWHCHCKSGTMSRSRAGKLHGLSGRLRVGALNELRTEHRPCTYQVCTCNKQLEECPLDSSLCDDHSCSSHAVFQSSTASLVPVHLRRRPILPPTSPSPSPALAFWKRVRIGLEDIWNSLSSVFTETQPVSFTDEPGPFWMNLRSLDVPTPVANIASVFARVTESCWAVVAHAFNPSTWEAEAGGFLSSRPPGLQDSEKPCLEKLKKKKKRLCRMPKEFCLWSFILGIVYQSFKMLGI